MSNKIIKIKCETDDVAKAISQIFMVSKSQLEMHVNTLLERESIPADTRITIDGNDIIVTTKTPEREFVIIPDLSTLKFSEYKAVPMDTRYIYVEKGYAGIFIKRPSGVDYCISQYEKIEEAAAAFNSNDTVAAHNNIVNPKEITTDKTNIDNGSVDAEGTTEDIVQEVQSDL